jgi:hypothetical protein
MANPPIGHPLLPHIEKDLLACGKKGFKGFLRNAVKARPFLNSIQEKEKSILRKEMVLNPIPLYLCN